MLIMHHFLHSQPYGTCFLELTAAANTHKNGGSILESTGHAAVVGEASVAVARWQRRAQEGLLSGVMGLGGALLGLSQGSGRRRGCRITSAKFGDIT